MSQMPIVHLSQVLMTFPELVRIEALLAEYRESSFVLLFLFQAPQI